MPRVFLPAWVRDKGISSQRELVLALLPYLEWLPRQDLKYSFELILPHTEQMDGRNPTLNRHLNTLKKNNQVEVKYGEVYNEKLTPPSYAYYRRIVKSAPKTQLSKSLLSGTYGLKKPEKKKRKKQKASVKDLTFDDLRYIQSNQLEMSGPQMAEMFKITTGMVYKIWKGHMPEHLKP